MQTKKGSPGKSSPGCFTVALLSVAFIIGGMAGGIVGGGVIWWAMSFNQNAPAPVVYLTPAPTHTATATPTATPAPTATATQVIIPTPSIEDVVARVLPSVVTVINIQAEYGYFNTQNDRRIVGSGIVVDNRGYIVTNAHVVDTPQSLTVILSNGEEFPAELVIYEPDQDLAMLKIEADNLRSAAWGNSEQVRLGQQVMAVGSALGDFPNSVTMGIVSGLNRALALDEVVVYGLIQTDAAINQGNSGGPLINLHGEVIGINTFIIREDHGQGVAQGIGFAIPASSVKMLSSAWINQELEQLQADNQNTVPQSELPRPLPASQPSDTQ